MIRLFKYFKNHKLRLLFTTIIKIIGTLFELVIPFLLSYILDDVIPKIEETNKIYPIFIYGAIMISCAFLFVIFNIIANRMANKTSTLITENLRIELFSKIETLSLHDLDTITLPSLVSRMSSDTYNVYQSLNTIQRLGLRGPFIFLGGITLCAILDLKLTLVFLIVSPLVLILIAIISKIGVKLFQDIQYKSDSLIRVVRENISGARVIKALGKEDYEKERYNKINEDVFKQEIKTGNTMGTLNPLINLFLNIGLVLAIIIGAYRVNDGKILVGTIIAFISYFNIISQALVSLSRIFEMASKGYASSARIDYVLKINTKRELSIPNSSSHFIEFRDVNFSYNGKENNLTNISFTLEEGETLGIIGATGSGKSTILNLMRCFYNHYDGDIYVNYNDIKSQNLKELNSLFGSVFQTDILFNDTILENITFGKKYDINLINNVLKMCDAYDFVYNLPNNLNTVIAAKGNDLSGGQKQRLLIARAILADPKILILDDSSSALDYKTDSFIRKNIKTLNKTSIIVAQRISSIMNSTKILVIDNGKILGYGDHNYLLSNCEAYKYIYDCQMGGDLNA